MTTKYDIAPFQLLDETDAPDKAKPYLEKARATFGLIPNVEKVMAQAPSLLAGYMTAWDQFNDTSLSEAERQVVYQVANFENNCQYCIPWHTILSESTDMSKHDIEALRNGAQLNDKKLDALRVFARDLVRTRGSIEPHALKSFFGAGYNEQHALEVILGLAVKTMSNYTNAIAQTPLDKEAQTKTWNKPSLRA